MVRGEPAAEIVVDAHGAELLILAAPVDQDGRRAALPQSAQVRADLAIGRDQDATHALLLEEVEIARLAVDVVVAVAEDHRQAVARSLALGPSGEVGEERVAHVEDDEPHRRAAADAQLPRRVVAHVAELLDRRAHATDGLRRHLLAVIEHVRDGAHRHPRLLSDVTDVGTHRAPNPSVLARATSSGLNTRCLDATDLSSMTSNSRSTTATPKPSWRPRTVLSGMMDASANSLSS